ncbi:hypothetical protein BGZ94_007899 [Podila epigama]|nr:hypothetical protein BGZ94_007899 [Podila epigama]
MASTSTPSTPTALNQGNDVETVTHIQMAGLTVLMIKKKDQVIYKLPDNMSVQSLTQEQRDRLLVEINLLHHQQTTAQAIAAAQAQTQQVRLAQSQATSGVRPIAPGRQGSTTAQQQNGAASTASGQGEPQKTTRKYNKTGKYSKKKQLQQQQLLEAQKQASQPALSSSSSSSSSAPLPASSSTPEKSTNALSATINHPDQVKLLTEIHQLHQALKLQETRTENLKEQEQILLRTLTLNAPIEAQNIQKQKVRQLVQEAEQTLALVKLQLQKKEALFRQLYPVASQQLLQLQQQQQQMQQQQRKQATASSLSSSVAIAPKLPGSGTGATTAKAALEGIMGMGAGRTGPPTVEEQLQQQIAEHHDSVRHAMAEELLQAQHTLTHQDYKTPFKSLQDAIERLVPYHIFQYPEEDLESHAKDFGTKFEAELHEKAVTVHKRKRELFEKYNDLVRSSAKKQMSNPSSALDILSLRYEMELERAEHAKVAEEFKVVKEQTELLKKELEARQVMIMQQRRAEALLIEQQQKLMLERQRLEEVARLEQQQRLQLQEEQQQSHMEEMQEHLQQQQELRLQEEKLQQKREEQLQRELEKHHKMELEKQLELKQQEQVQEQEQQQEQEQAPKP